jgi:transcriptional regulator with XRE-family HTH domain
MTIILTTPKDVALGLAVRAKARRLAFNLSQETMAEQAGVSLGTLKKFEHTGKVSLETLLKIALVLEALDAFEQLFLPPKPEAYLTLDALLKDKSRKRGRR